MNFKAKLESFWKNKMVDKRTLAQKIKDQKFGVYYGFVLLSILFFLQIMAFLSGSIVSIAIFTFDVSAFLLVLASEQYELNKLKLDLENSHV